MKSDNAASTRWLAAVALGSLVWAIAGCPTNEPAETKDAAQPPDTTAPQDAGGDATTDVGADTPADVVQPLDVPPDPGPADPGPPDPGPPPDHLTVSLPQASAGAACANPAMQATIPLHVVVVGPCAGVEVTIADDPPLTATDADGDGDWIAELPIDGRPDGPLTVSVTALGEGVPDESAELELVLASESVWFTKFDEVGGAGTPRIHERDGVLRMSWTDRSDGGAPRGWLQEIDGAGRGVSDAVQITPAEVEALKARTAVGASSVAVLYQVIGGHPYFNHLQVVDLEGNELLAPMALDPPGTAGNFGGRVVYDGDGFVVVFRASTNDGVGSVHWLRIDEQTLQMTGPVEVASSGEGAPDGGFDPFSFVDVAVLGDSSVVTFRRDFYHGMLEMGVPRAQLAVVGRDGSVEPRHYLGGANALMWHWNAHVHRVRDVIVPLWTTDDLMDPQPVTPTSIRGAQLDADALLAPDEGGGIIIVQEPDTREEPFLMDHPTHFGVMAWSDHRTYSTGGMQSGRIEVMVAPVDESLQAGQQLAVPKSRLFAGMAQINGVALGSNAHVVWTDERNGGGVMDPKPEVRMECVWY